MSTQERSFLFAGLLVVMSTLVISTASANSGANTFSVPLSVAPGVAGVEPTLALEYDSRAGLGPLGFGWSLPDSTVEVDVRLDPDVYARGWSDSYLVDGVRFFVHSGQWVPEVEDQTRMERVQNATGDSFTIFDPDGSMREYGTTAESRLMTRVPAAGGGWTDVTMRAHLTRMVDPSGLAIVYEYDYLDGDVPHLVSIGYTLDHTEGTSVGPLHRVDLEWTPLPLGRSGWTPSVLGARRAITHRVTAIHETVEQGGSPDVVRSYLLAYDDTPTNGGWLLANVMEQGAPASSGTRPVREVIGGLAYSPDGATWDGWTAEPMVGAPCGAWEGTLLHGTIGNSVSLQGVTKDWFDLSGDGLPDCVVAYGGHAGSGPADLDVAFSTDAPGEVGPVLQLSGSFVGLPTLVDLREIDDGEVTATFLDFNGDGYQDRVENLGGDLVWSPAADNIQFDVPRSVWSAGPQDRLPAEEVAISGVQSRLVDLTGDGKPEYIQWNANTAAATWTVWRNVDDELKAPEQWVPVAIPSLHGWPEISRTTDYEDLASGWNVLEAWTGLLDMNGDGLLDFVIADAGAPCSDVDPATCTWIVYFGTGRGFDPVPLELDTGMHGGDPGRGDHLPISRTLTPECQFSIYPQGCAGSASTTFPPSGIPATFVADLDGDGLLDLSVASSPSSLTVFNQAGSEFGPPTPTALPFSWNSPGAGAHHLAALGLSGELRDFDADGALEWVSADGTYSNPTNGGAPISLPHLLEELTLPTGGVVSFEYAAAAGTATDLGWALPSQREGARPIWNLTGVQFDDPTVGDVEFHYTGPTWWDGTFHGYGVVDVVHLNGQTGAAEEWSRSEYSVGDDGSGAVWPLQGRLLASSSWAGDYHCAADPTTCSDQLSASSRAWEAIPTPVQSGTTWSIGLTGLDTTSTGITGLALTRTWTVTPDHTLGGRARIIDDEGGPGAQDDARTEWLWAAAAHPHGPGVMVLLDGRTVSDGGTPMLTTTWVHDTAGNVTDTIRLGGWSGQGLGTIQMEREEFGTGIGLPDRRFDASGTLTSFAWAPDYLSVTATVEVTPPAPGSFIAPSEWPTVYSSVDHVWTMNSDPRWGPAETRYGDGVGETRRRTIERDEFGRTKQIEETIPGAGSAQMVAPTTTIDRHTARSGSWVRTTTHSYDPQGASIAAEESTSYQDGFGRAVEAWEKVGAAEHLVTFREFDGLGRVSRVSVPMTTAALASLGLSGPAPMGPPPWFAIPHSEITYGSDGRTTQSLLVNGSPEDPSESIVTMWNVVAHPVTGAPSLRWMTQTPHEATSATSYEYRDARGLATYIEDAEGNDTQLEYDPHGRLIRTIDALTNQVEIAWDEFGRRIRLEDPDVSACVGGPASCPVLFDYDASDNLIGRTDALGRTIEYAYDELGRERWRTGGCEATPGDVCSNPEEGTAFFLHDGLVPGPGALAGGIEALGATTGMIDPSGWTEYGVDRSGAVVDEHRNIAGEEFWTSIKHDTVGRILAVEVAHGGTSFDPLDYSYDVVGNLTGVMERGSGMPWISHLERDQPSGLLTRLEAFGGAVAADFDYTDAGRLLSYSTSADLFSGGGTPVSLPLQDVLLSYDDAGRSGSRTDFINGSTDDYTYDLLGRLTSVGGPTSSHQRTYSYDAIGNFSSNSLQADRYGDGTYLPGTAGPHAVGSIGSPAGPHSLFDYDDDGSLLHRSRIAGLSDDFDRWYDYGADGRLREVENVPLGGSGTTTTTSLLDPFGRVRRTVTEGGVSKETYTPNSFIELRNGLPVKFVVANGQRLGETSATSFASGTETATWFVYDHQGKQEAAVAVRGPGVIDEYIDHTLVRRDPYGAVLDGDPLLLSLGLANGQVDPDGETRLGARTYDPELGRFLQADSLAGIGQAANRYRFAWNSPTNYVDPTGLWEEPTSLPRIGNGLWSGPDGECQQSTGWVRILYASVDLGGGGEFGKNPKQEKIRIVSCADFGNCPENETIVTASKRSIPTNGGNVGSELEDDPLGWRVDLDVVRSWTSNIAGGIPLLGDGVNLVGAIAGKDLITGKALSTSERISRAGWGVLGIATGGVGSKLKYAGKGLAVAAVGVKALGKAARAGADDAARGAAQLGRRIRAWRQAASKGGQKALPAPRKRGNPNAAPEHGTFHVDPRGNSIPTPKGGHLDGSPDGRYLQAKDATGKSTGVRIDGGHRPAGHSDPRARSPHAHVPGVTNPDGTEWLPIQ